MVSVGQIAAAGSVAAVILIVLTYKRAQIPRDLEVEEQLRGRMEGKALKSDYGIVVDLVSC